MSNRKYDLTYVLLILAVAAAIVFMGMLARENSHLKFRLANAVSAEKLDNVDAVAETGGDISGPPELLAGDGVPAFRTMDLDGQGYSVALDGKAKYAFFIFSPGCGSCRSQISLWNNLAAQAKGGSYKPVALCLDHPGKNRDVVNSLQQHSAVVMMPNMAIQRSFRATSIPLFVLVSGDGKVEWVNYGALSEAKFKEVSSKLSH